jgi:hypothetical protein
VADDAQLQAIDGGASSSVPVFGKRTEAIGNRKLRRFGLEIETIAPAKRGQPAVEERFVEEFDALFELDGGAILTMLNAPDAMRQAQAVASLLATSLYDLDGVPVEWAQPGPAREDEDDDESPALRAPAADGEEEGEELFVRWDGELVEFDDLQFDELEEGSSRRRFAYLMRSARYRIRVEALNEIAEWLTAEYAERPTRRPTSSRRGQSRTGRTSGGRSHSKRG